MLSLITGLPGNAKTLYTITKVVSWRKDQENKTGKLPNVYYFNIVFDENHEKFELVKDWIKLNKSEVQSIYLTEEQEENSDTVLDHAAIVEFNSSNPDTKIKTVIENGSILVIDESQDLYPTRSASAKVPRFVKFLEKHRHSGFNFYFITQDPSYLDIHLRRLINYHYELDRHGKAEVSNVNISPKGLLKECPQNLVKMEVFKFPKSWFGLYKSAVEHTQTGGVLDFIKGMPLKAKVVIFLSILFAIYSIYKLSGEGFGINALSSSPEENPQSLTSDVSLENVIPVDFSNEEVLPIFYLSHVLYSSGISVPVFELVYSDSTSVTLHPTDLEAIGYELKTIRAGVYLINNKLITNFPINKESSDEAENNK